MPNSIKYSLSAQTLALKYGNFWIGTNDVGKGPSSVSEYWNGITPPTGGYTIYLNKATQGPSIYVAANDNELIFLTNKIGSQYFTTVDQCLSWYLTQSDKMVINGDYTIKTTGLTLMVDAGLRPSYPTTGNTWYDLSAGFTGTNPTLQNGATFSSLAGGCIVFDGINDYCSTSLSKTFTSMTIQVWFYGDARHQTRYCGLVGQRFGGGVTSLFLNGNSSGWIGYNWNDMPLAYEWYPGFIPNYWGWHFVSLSVSPTVATIFYNGSTSSNSISHAPTVISQLDIGRENKDDRWLNGAISSVYIYDRALSNAEVLENYNATLGRYSSFPQIPYYRVWENCTIFVVYLASGGFTVGNTVYTNGNFTTKLGSRIFTQADLGSIGENDYTYTGIVTNSLGVITQINYPMLGCYVPPSC
jgi:hypothetical protein